MANRIVICCCAVFCMGILADGQVSTSRPSPPGIPAQGTAPKQSKTPPTKKAHSVHLRWQPSSTKNIAGYYVYRADGGPNETYVRLTPKPIRGTQYVDTDVAPGKTYAYQISAVVVNGHAAMESDRTPPQVVSVPDP